MCAVAFASSFTHPPSKSKRVSALSPAPVRGFWRASDRVTLSVTIIW